MYLYKSLLLFASISGFIFSIIVFAFGKDKLSKNTLSLYNLTFSLWCLSQYFGEISIQKSTVLFWTRINLLFAVLLPFFYLIFVSSFTKKIEKTKTILYIFSFLTLILLMTLPTRYFVEDLSTTTFFKYYPKGGIFYNLFLLLFIAEVSFGLFELIITYKNSEHEKRNQIAYIILASVIGFGGGIFWFLPAYGFDTYPIGIFITPFYLLAGAYAVVRHRLLDIKIVISKWLVYSIIIVLFTALYYVLTFSLLYFFRQDFGLFPTILILICFAILFDPLKMLFQKLINRLIFGRHYYNYSKLLKKLSFEISGCLSLDDLANLLINNFTKFMNVCEISFYIYDESSKIFRQIISSKNFLNTFVELSPSIAILKNFKGIKFCDDDILDEERVFMKTNGIKIFVPLISQNDLLGFILFGRKKSRFGWTKEDIDLLEAIMPNLSVVLKNILLQERLMNDQLEICKTEKASAISMISQQMAHEIKNPLTSIKGLLQGLEENKNNPMFLENFISVVSKQLEKISTVMNKLINLEKNFSKIFRKDIKKEYINIPEVIEDILKIYDFQFYINSIKVVQNFCNKFMVEFERDAFEQVVFNLVTNAIQAMPNGGILTIMMKDNSLIISDTGEGISEENLDKIFDPFFTTKDGGSGLGLAIVKKILSENGAGIEVDTKKGKGTTFTIFFNKGDRKC